jgi:predicted nucleotidyltransferase
MKTILRLTSGSRAYGCHNEDSDHDSNGVCLESLEERMSLLHAPFEQMATDGADGQIYSLEKFCRLASKGNPNIVEMLYSPVLEYTKEGNELIELRSSFWSKNAGRAFLGYMQAQKERLQGTRGQKDVNRKELVEKYGYDTKYAYHIIRLGLIGREYLQSGYICLPMRPLHVSILKAIRAGEWKVGEVIQEAEELENQLKLLLQYGNAPENPDTAKIEKWMRKSYLTHWSENNA